MLGRRMASTAAMAALALGAAAGCSGLQAPGGSAPPEGTGDACSRGVKATDPGVVSVHCGGTARFRVQAGSAAKTLPGGDCVSAGDSWSATVGVVIDYNGLHGVYAGPQVDVVSVNNTTTPGRGTVQVTLDADSYFDLDDAALTLSADHKSAHIEGTSEDLSDDPGAAIVVDITC